MKQTLSVNQAAHILLQDSYANWSYNGAIALCEYLEQLEEDCDIEIEFDVVALRCDYSEYSSIEDVFSEYADPSDLADNEEEFDEDAALEYLRDRTEVIEFSEGIIIRSF